MLLELTPELLGLLWPASALLDSMQVCKRLHRVLPLHTPRLALTIKRDRFEILHERVTCRDVIESLKRFQDAPLDLQVPSIYLPAQSRYRPHEALHTAWASWNDHRTAVLGITAALRDGLLHNLVAMDVGIVCCVQDITAAIRASCGTLESVCLQNNKMHLSEFSEVFLALRLCSRLRTFKIQDHESHHSVAFSIVTAYTVEGLLDSCECLKLIDIDLGTVSEEAAALLVAALKKHSDVQLRVSGPSEAAMFTLLEVMPALCVLEFAEWDATLLEAITARLPHAACLQRIVIWCSVGSSILELEKLDCLDRACAAHAVELQQEWV